MVAAKAELHEEGLHIRCNLPPLQHELAGLWPEGRGKTIHAAVESRSVEVKLANPFRDQCSFPVSIVDWKFKCDLAPLVADSQGDRFGAVEVVHELLLMSVDKVSCVVISLSDVQWLKLAAADATEGKPDQDVATKAAVLDEVHNRA